METKPPNLSTAEGATPSEVCATLTLLDGIHAFEEHLHLILGEGVRQVHILSKRLDPALFSTATTCKLISDIARRHRQTEVFVLVREPQDIVNVHHDLVALQQRLPSKIHLRRSTIDTDPDTRAFVIVDRKLVLFQHNDGDYEGFCNTEAAPEARAWLEEYNELWHRHSDEIKDLRTLLL